MNFTIETLQDDKHQITLDDLSLICLRDIMEGTEMFGGANLNTKQRALHWIFADRIKARPDLTDECLDAMNFIDELFLFLGQNWRNGMLMSEPANEILNKI